MERRLNIKNWIEDIIADDNGKSFFYLESFDIAEFKQINYHYGFEAGNQFLKETENFIQNIPQCVFCMRVISDRFIVMTKHDKKQTVEELIASFELWWNKFRQIQQREFPACSLKLWCGIYQYSGEDIQIAIENAELARQKARERQDDSVLYCDSSLVEELTAKKDLENYVLKALEEERFEFWLQPQVDIETGKILSAEALARGKFESGEFISPDVFIPILEKNGNIVKLDLLILRQVCQSLRNRLDLGKDMIQISVNLSRIDFRYENLVQEIEQIVSMYQIPHEYIEFEMTENVVLESFNMAYNIMERLNKLGYKTSIDDFGSGYAGVDACRRLNFDELKLDKSMIDDIMDRNGKGWIIINGIISIAHRLGVRVICEGAETMEQCREIFNIGCSIIQGYYFSKPVPSEEFYQGYDTINGKYAVGL